MSRDMDPRPRESERPNPSQGSRGGGSDLQVRSPSDHRDVFARDLDLPRGAERELVWVRTKPVDLSGSDVKTLATVGAFRVVSASDLRTESRDLRHLRDAGLVRTMAHVKGRDRTMLVTLTEEGRTLLENARHPAQEQVRQEFYAGIVKPRELAHDSRLYEAYLLSTERLSTTGARVRRVVLDYELKRDYQRFLHEENRARRDSGGKPNDDGAAVAEWARSHQLPVIDDHVRFPDVRIEYEDRDGRDRVEDIEVSTPHYRGAHRAATAQSGFTTYRAVGARLGGGARGARGGGSFDPRVAEEVLG